MEILTLSSTRVKALTQAENGETPGWIKDVCTDWLHVISHFRKNGKEYKFYSEKISGLLEVIRPAYLMGVNNWLNSGSGNYSAGREILKSHLEGTLKLIKIICSPNNLAYIYAIKELETLLKQV